VLRAPELDAGLLEGASSEWSRGVPHPAGSTAGDAALDTVGPLDCKRTLLGHSSFSSTSTSKYFSAGLLSVPSSSSLY